MSVAVTLRQEKTILTSTFALTSWITVADPTELYALFVISQGTNYEDEQWERVATLDDLAQYSENKLTKIVAGTAGQFSSIGAAAGDILEITNVPEAWLTTNFTIAKFTVASVDVAGDYLLVEEAVPFPSAQSTAEWTLRNGNESIVRGSGTAAKIYREDTSEAVWLRQHWTAEFSNVKKALARLTANETGVEALVEDIKTYGATYEGIETESYT